MVLTVVLMDIIFAYLLFFCSFDEVRFEDDEKIEKYAVQIECYGNNTRIVLLW